MATRKRAPRANGHGSNDHGAPIEREQRELICKLSDAEMLDRSDRMAEAELAIEKLKEQRKGVNGQIADAAAERARLAHVIEAGEESRVVDCAWHDDFPKNVKRLIRQDTGAEVDTRPMTGQDRQIGLELPPVDTDASGGGPGGDVIQLAPAKRKRGRPRKVPPTAAGPTIHQH